VACLTAHGSVSAAKVVFRFGGFFFSGGVMGRSAVAGLEASPQVHAEAADTPRSSHRVSISESAMLYVMRDASGEISSLHRTPVVGAQVLPPDHPEVRAFVLMGEEEQQFASLDASFLRVLEDVIDALLRRNVLCITDLPSEAQHKLFDRKHFRENARTHALDLFASYQQPREEGAVASAEESGTVQI
jgi:hypothetical protein